MGKTKVLHHDGHEIYFFVSILTLEVVIKDNGNIDQNDPVMMGLLKSTMFPLQQVLEGEERCFEHLLKIFTFCR